jgi:hypothetical protein
MSPHDDTLARLQSALSAAEADVERLRKQNAELADAFRAEPTDDGREALRRAAQSLHAARDRVEAARAKIAVFEHTGSEHGLVAEGGRVFGSIAVAIPPGTGQRAREEIIDAALSPTLTDRAAELGLVLAATPSRFVRELPGRDAEGRTVLEVAGRAEGDVLVPATRGR